MALPVKRNKVLPTAGVPAAELVTLMRGFHAQDVPRWKDGKASGAVYHGGEEHMALQDEVNNVSALAHSPFLDGANKLFPQKYIHTMDADSVGVLHEHSLDLRRLHLSAFKLFNVSNPLHGDIWPSVTKFEAEAMTASLLGGGDPDVCGTLTSGGTESIIMAVKAHRQKGEQEKGITAPEIICADSAHAAIDKACDMLRIKLIKIPVNPTTYQADVAAFRSAITPNTVMLYSSAPNYPQGAIDPISELSALALEHDVGLHVDCCLGGFFLPFARRLPELAGKIPEFDFALPGVTSISADTHKYGYATKGTSVVLYRNAALRRHQFFFFPRWSGGIYITPSTAGSRPGALSAACWASMMALGDEGFMHSTRLIVQTVAKMKAAIPTIPGLFLLGDPVGMVVAIGSDKFNIFRLSDAMAESGYSVSQCQHPSCIHFCVTLRHVEHIDAIIESMRVETAKIMATPDAKAEGQGAAIYGMAASMPTGSIVDMLASYMDGVYAFPELTPAEKAQSKL